MVDQSTGARSVLAFIFVGWREAEGRPEAGPFTARMLEDFEKRGEPWLWGCDPDKLADFLASSSWQITVEPEPAGMDNLTCVQKP